MQILGPDRYNPEKLKELEADVQVQASGGEYNSDVNFTVLRIYQFYPAYANAGVVQKVLLMVRRFFPSPLFLPSSLESLRNISCSHVVNDGTRLPRPPQHPAPCTLYPEPQPLRPKACALSPRY
jgi:hypothetical protein